MKMKTTKQKPPAKSQSAHMYAQLIRREHMTTGGVAIRENSLAIRDDGEHTPELHRFVPDDKQPRNRGRGAFPTVMAGHFESSRQSAQEAIVDSARDSQMRLKTRARTTYQPSRSRDRELED